MFASVDLFVNFPINLKVIKCNSVFHGKCESGGKMAPWISSIIFVYFPLAFGFMGVRNFIFTDVELLYDVFKDY